MAAKRARTSQKRRPGLIIKFVRSGGFAGIRLARTVDTMDLEAEPARRLQALVDEAGFFELPDSAAPTRVVPDSIMYQITIAAGEQSRAITVSETTAPAQLRPLLDYLTKFAKLGHAP